MFFPCFFSLLSASLRSELNHLHASAIEHMRHTHQQETAAAKQELEKALEQSRVQVKYASLKAEYSLFSNLCRRKYGNIVQYTTFPSFFNCLLYSRIETMTTRKYRSGYCSKKSNFFVIRWLL